MTLLMMLLACQMQTDRVGDTGIQTCSDGLTGAFDASCPSGDSDMVCLDPMGDESSVFVTWLSDRGGRWDSDIRKTCIVTAGDDADAPVRELLLDASISVSTPPAVCNESGLTTILDPSEWGATVSCSETGLAAGTWDLVASGDAGTLRFSFEVPLTGSVCGEL